MRSIVFVDDGYGGETLSIATSLEPSTTAASAILEQTLTLYVDALDITDLEGKLYRAEDLLQAYLKAWTGFMFNGLSQIDLSATIDEDGQLVSIERGDYLPISYIKRYVEEFGEKWVRAYIAQEAPKAGAVSDTMKEELEAQLIAEPIRMADFMVQNLGSTFIFYISGVEPAAGVEGVLAQSLGEFYGDDYREIINAFFDQFSELVEIKEALQN